MSVRGIRHHSQLIHHHYTVPILQMSLLRLRESKKWIAKVHNANMWLSWDFNPVLPLNPVLDSEGLCIWYDMVTNTWAALFQWRVTAHPNCIHCWTLPPLDTRIPTPVLHCRGAILRESFSESYSLIHCHLYATYFSLRSTRQGLRVLEIINSHSLFMPEEISPGLESTLPSPPENQDGG